MAVKTPADMHFEFARAFNSGEASAVLALYEPEACLAAQPGQTVHGQQALREALAEFLALKGRISITTRSIIEAGDLALLYGDWSLVGTGADGSPVSMSGRNNEVARRQSDGSWLMVIDNPFGEA
jgi:ketosteroid isomerase-like protein